MLLEQYVTCLQTLLKPQKIAQFICNGGVPFHKIQTKLLSSKYQFALQDRQQLISACYNYFILLQNMTWPSDNFECLFQCTCATVVPLTKLYLTKHLATFQFESDFRCKQEHCINFKRRIEQWTRPTRSRKTATLTVVDGAFIHPQQASMLLEQYVI